MSEAPTTPSTPGPPDGDGTKRVPPWFTRAVGLVMLAVAGLFAGYKIFLWLRPLLLILLVSFFLALALEPAVNALARRGWRRGVATVAVFVVVGVAGVAFAVTIGGLLFAQLRDLVVAAPTYASNLVEFLNGRFGLDISVGSVMDRLEAGRGATGQVVGGVAGSAVAIASGVLGAVFNLFTAVLFTFYLVADAPRLRLAVQRVLPRRHRATFVQAWVLAVDSTGGYLYSRALLAAISATFHAVAFSVVGVPNAVALGVWVGIVSQLVPTVGTYLAGALPVLVALASNPVAAVWVLGIVIAYQQIENYLLVPRVTAQTMSLHPAVAFGAVIAGALVMGAVGALLALPAAAMVQASVATWGNLPVLDEVHHPPERPAKRRPRWPGRREAAAG